jgi:ABC-type transport system substrate-binding protein
VVLARNPRYRGRFSGNVQRVVLNLINDAPRQLKMYEDDELDVFAPELLDRTTMRLARQRHTLEDLSLPRGATKIVGFDVTRPPFDDVRVRRAFALATDRTALADVVSCTRFPATGGFVPPGTPGHTPGIAAPFDPQRAHRLLSEAGYPGGRGFPAVVLNYVRGGEALCEELQAQWLAHLGIKVAWETLDWGVLLDSVMDKRSQMFAIGQPGYYPDPDCFLRAGWFPRWTGWRHAEYDQLLESAKRITESDDRMELYARAEEVLVKEAPIVPLMYMFNMVLVKPWVTKFPYASPGRPFWKDVVLEPH